ncbi:MAG TPA: hypothetical protein RWO09_10825 [Ruminococcus sp.]
MSEEKKKPESEEEKKPESSEAEKPEEKKEEPPKSDDAEEKSSDDKQADESGEGAESESEEKSEPGKKAHPDTSETDRLKAENLTLKTQLEALKIGFKPDCIEDAVVLAENLVKRDGSDITAALQSVAKKYPDWKSDAKSDKSAGGFKVGADSGSKEKNPDSSRLSQAFGIKKKGKV